MSCVILYYYIIICHIILFQYPFIFRGADLDEEKIKKFDEAFKFLDLYLGQSDWAAGDNLTVADFALVSSVSTAEVTYLVGYTKSVLNSPNEIISFFESVELPNWDLQETSKSRG